MATSSVSVVAVSNQAQVLGSLCSAMHFCRFYGAEVHSAFLFLPSFFSFMISNLPVCCSEAYPCLTCLRRTEGYSHEMLNSCPRGNQSSAGGDGQPGLARRVQSSCCRAPAAPLGRSPRPPALLAASEAPLPGARFRIKTCGPFLAFVLTVVERKCPACSLN